MAFWASPSQSESALVCPICKSTSFHQNAEGFYICTDCQTLSQDHGILEVNEVDQALISGRTRYTAVTDGQKKRKEYIDHLEAFQRILQVQVEAMISKFHMPKDYYEEVGSIWFHYLEARAEFYATSNIKPRETKLEILARERMERQAEGTPRRKKHKRVNANALLREHAEQLREGRSQSQSQSQQPPTPPPPSPSASSSVFADAVDENDDDSEVDSDFVPRTKKRSDNNKKRTPKSSPAPLSAAKRRKSVRGQVSASSPSIGTTSTAASASSSRNDQVAQAENDLRLALNRLVAKEKMKKRMKGSSNDAEDEDDADDSDEDEDEENYNEEDELNFINSQDFEADGDSDDANGGNDGDGNDMQQKKKAKSRRGMYANAFLFPYVLLEDQRHCLPRLPLTLSILLLAAMNLNQVVLATDIIGWVKRGELPYLSAYRHLNGLVRHRYLVVPETLPTSWWVETALIRLCRAIRHPKPCVHLPSLCFRYCQELQLPRTAYRAAYGLMKLCAIDGNELYEKNELTYTQGPPGRAHAMAFLLVLLKMCWKLEDSQQTQQISPAVPLPKYSDWVAKMEQIFAVGDGIPMTSAEVDRLSRSDYAAYVEYCREHIFLSDAILPESEGLLDALEGIVQRLRHSRALDEPLYVTERPMTPEPVEEPDLSCAANYVLYHPHAYRRHSQYDKVLQICAKVCDIRPETMQNAVRQLERRLLFVLRRKNSAQQEQKNEKEEKEGVAEHPAAAPAAVSASDVDD